MTIQLGRIERYILVRTSLGVGGALAVIATVVALIDFVELSRTVGVRSEVGFSQILTLTLLNAPTVSLILLPFAFLFGVLAAFMGLNRRSELIALRAAGVSAWRFIAPAAIGAMAAGLVTVTLLNPLTSALNARFEHMRAQLMEGYGPVQSSEVWIRQGDASAQVVIRAQARDGSGDTLKLAGVTVFIARRDADGAVQFTRRVDAERAELRPGYWYLTNGQEATPGAAASRFDTLTLPTALTPANALERYAAPTSVPFWSLWSVINRSEQAGFSATGYRLEFDRLLAMPLMFAAMTIVAAAFSLRLARLGGLIALGASGAALGSLIYFVSQFCLALGKSGAIPPFAAAWAPPTVAVLAGLTLLSYTEDG